MKPPLSYQPPDLAWWFVNTCLIGLAPLLLAAIGHYIVSDATVPIASALRFGVLIFYGYSISVQLLKEDVGSVQRLRRSLGKVNERYRIEAFSRASLPLLVSALSVLCCWKILCKENTGPSLVYMQATVVVLAIVSSFEHCVWVRRLFRKQSERKQLAAPVETFDDR